MRGRRHVGAARVLHREAQCVADATRAERRFFITCQAGEDGQAGRIGAGPARLCGRAHAVAVEVEHGASVGIPRAVGVGERAVELVQAVVVAIDDEHVAIAVDGGRAFDRGRRRHRVRAGVALVAVGRPVHRDARLRAGHHDIWNADRRTVVRARAEVGVQPGREADAGDQRVGVGVDRGRRNVGVPGVAGRERERAVEVGAAAERGPRKIAVGRASGRRCRRWRGGWRRRRHRCWCRRGGRRW